MEFVPAKTIVTKTKSDDWFGMDYNMNIYRGCCHGCIYCDSRSDCYHIERFDEVRAKENALEIIRDDLRRKVKKGVIGTGSMSDPYNPFEKEMLLTRHALELADAFEFGIGIAGSRYIFRHFTDAGASVFRGYGKKCVRGCGSRSCGRGKFYLSCVWNDSAGKSENLVF